MNNAELAILPTAQIDHPAGMDKDALIKQLDGLPRGARAELARELGINPDVLSKLLNTKRKITAEEADTIRKFMVKHGISEGLYSQSDSQVHKKVILRERDMRSLDAGVGVLVPLWIIGSPVADVAGAAMSIAKSEGDFEFAPMDLKTKDSAFAVQAWDDTNAPWLRRGSLLYVMRATGRDGDWCLFGKTAGRRGTDLKSPMVGLLLAKTTTVWRIQVGTERSSLPLNEWAVAWRIIYTKH